MKHEQSLTEGTKLSLGLLLAIFGACATGLSAYVSREVANATIRTEVLAIKETTSKKFDQMDKISEDLAEIKGMIKEMQRQEGLHK